MIFLKLQKNTFEKNNLKLYISIMAKKKGISLTLVKK